MSSYHQEVASISVQIKKFFEKTFSSISVDGPKVDPAALNANPLMLVSSHRSHVDYFLVGDLFHLMGFKNLRFAAGDNLTNLPWIGPKFKAFGAFAIERDTGFDRNYVKNLCYNVVSMIERGDTVLVFPEGGRSYSGAMLEMRIGVLGASILSQANTPDRDVNYIPITISYENAPDVPWYDMQQKGKKWRKHTNILPKRWLGNVLYYGADACSFLPFLFSHYLKRKYGNVYIDYGHPIAIRSLIDVSKKAENARDDFSAHRDSMLKLGTMVYDQLSTLYRILPMHVVAAQLAQHGKRSISDLADAFPEVISTLKAKNRNVKQLESKNPSENVNEGIRQLKKNNAITFSHNICSIKKQTLINYFAATIG
jgi:glycerol-3-phosphate O-acyltransferase